MNEAAVEWPPSPWRLLRALVSAWHRTEPGLSASDVREALDVLAAPPRYHLPTAAPGHTRHWMADGNHRREVHLTQGLVFDAFLRVGPGDPLLAVWDADPTPATGAVLRRLAAGVTYLGRAESWCDIEVVDGDWDGANVRPLEGGLSDDREVVRLLGVTRPLDLQVLEVSTADLHGGRHKYRDPPGSCWLRYSRSREWSRPRSRQRRKDGGRAAEAVLWALDGSPLPLLTRVEDVVRAVRNEIRLEERSATGRISVVAYPSEPDMRPVRVDRIALWAERGLDRRELDIVRRLGPFRVPGMGGVQTPLLLRFGRAEDIGGPLFGPGRVWRSVTPLVAMRPVDVPADSPIEDRIVALVDRPGVRVLGPAGGPVSWLEFRQGAAVGARVEFPTPVVGPVVAGAQRPGFGLFLQEA